MFTVWACDHLWERYDAHDLDVWSQIHSVCHEQATDGYYDVGLVIPLCDECKHLTDHIVVSFRELAHPFDDDAWAEVAAYEDQQWELEKARAT